MILSLVQRSELRSLGGGMEAARGLHGLKERSTEGNHEVSLRERNTCRKVGSRGDGIEVIEG